MSNIDDGVGHEEENENEKEDYIEIAVDDMKLGTTFPNEKSGHKQLVDSLLSLL